MANWTDAEVLHLIELWEEEGIQEQLEGAKRNKHVFEKIAKELQKTGSEKTAEQCRTKLKKLKLDYRKVKDKQDEDEQVGGILMLWLLKAALAGLFLRELRRFSSESLLSIDPTALCWKF